ncbi:MAG: winged helix-turn-helix transcriptional regulator [Candidatus Omnitrophica bacterium]|nr:winged helix-turn-helix transcriptional regulator [Candidatus Omnitrophota bacterium]
MLKTSKILKLLSDSNRLRILQLLRQRKLCVCELAYVVGVTQPSISRHLKKLKASGLVEQEQAGFWTDYYFKLNDSIHRDLLNSVFKSFEDEPIVKEDLVRLRKANRKKLCCK